MLDSRKYCPQCGGERLKYQAPKTILVGFVVMMGSVFITLSLLMLAAILKPAPVESILNLAELFIVLAIPITGLVFITTLMRSRKVNDLEFKCGQCGYHWTITKEEWLQAEDTPVQTKILSPQEKQQKKEAVESLINFFTR
jgi:hypothetical protein